MDDQQPHLRALRPLAIHIQAILFSEGTPVSLKSLATALAVDTRTLLEGLDEVRTMLEGSGLALVTTDREAALAVSDAGREAVVRLKEKELERGIGDAGLEVLAILLYEGAATRAAVEYIRGVNSSSTIRTLLSRGLIKRTANPADAREYLYTPTVELLAHLGVRAVQELPDYDTITRELRAFLERAEHHERADTDESGDRAE